MRIHWAVLGEGKCMVNGPDWANVRVHDPGDWNSNDSFLELYSFAPRYLNGCPPGVKSKVFFDKLRTWVKSSGTFGD